MMKQSGKFSGDETRQGDLVLPLTLGWTDYPATMSSHTWPKIAEWHPGTSQRKENMAGASLSLQHEAPLCWYWDQIFDIIVIVCETNCPRNPRIHLPQMITAAQTNKMLPHRLLCWQTKNIYVLTLMVHSSDLLVWIHTVTWCLASILLKTISQWRHLLCL